MNRSVIAFSVEKGISTLLYREGITMEQKKLARWLKTAIIAAGICGIGVYFYICRFGQFMAADYIPEASECLLPWLVLVFLSAVPCYVILIFGWAVATNIGKGCAFSHANGTHVMMISRLFLADALILFLGNIILWLMGFNHPGVVIMLLIPECLLVAVSGACAVLSRLIRQAAELKEQNDLTI